MGDFHVFTSSRLIWVAILLLAFYLRVAGLFANSFHADEALFASWARHIAVWKDPLLVTQAVDKPPLLFYAQALFFPLLGPVEWAARMPNFIASLLIVPLTAVLLQTLYKKATHSPLHLRRSAPHLAIFTTVLIITLSPLAIQFSSTAFTDPLLIFWLVAALAVASRWSLARGKLWIAGLLFGLAVATKYQAWLFLPLFVGLGWLRSWRWRDWARFVGGIVPIILAVLLWEWARTGTFSLWSAQISNFGGLRLVWSWELWPRLLAWGNLGQTAVPIYILPLFVLIIIALFGRAWRVGDEYGRIDILLILFLLGYLLLHWLLAVPVWDRYLLPLLPIVAVLLGRGVWEMGRWGAGEMRGGRLEIGDWGLSRLHVYTFTRFIFFILLILLLFPAFAARNGRFPMGGQRLADDGAAEIAEFLADAPYGTVLYDHWYSWQWGYHLFDKRVFVSWFPDAEALLENLAVFGDDGSPRYIVLPNTAVSQPIQRALQDAGFTLQPVANTGKITLFAIVPDAGIESLRH